MGTARAVQCRGAQSDLRITVRHAIMQVNYFVRVRSVAEKISSWTVSRGERQWFPLDEAVALPLTGLTRKVLEPTDCTVVKVLKP